MTKQENLLKKYLDYNMKSQRFTATHIAKSLEKPIAQPKLVNDHAANSGETVHPIPGKVNTF